MFWRSLTHRGRRSLVSLASLALAFSVWPAAAPAQSDRPAAGGDPALVVSLGSMNQLMQDINYLTGAVGQPQAGGMFTVMAGAFTQGIDPTLPMGVVVHLVDGAPEPIALLPTPDVKTVLKRLEAQAGPADELEDGTLVLLIGANNVFVRQVGNWAVIARSREVIDAAPADPMAVLGEMGQKYDLAVQLRVQDIPPALRDQLVEMIRQGFDQALAQQPQADADATREATEATLDQLEQLIRDTEQLRFGLDIDPSAKQVSFDVSMTAVGGSELAQIYQGQTAIPSRFASVIRDDAAMFFHAASSISPAAIEQSKASLENSLEMVRGAIVSQGGLSAQERDEVTALVDRIGALIIASVAEGKSDAGALMIAADSKPQLVLGAFVADGNEAAKIVKDLAQKVEGQDKAPRFEFDRSVYNGVTMHLVEADVPEKAEEARKVFGETVRLHVGTAPQAVYLALGNASAPLLQQLIDAADSDQVTDRPLAQMRLKLMPILEYAQSIEANDTVGAMLEALARSPDPGTVRFVSESIPNGTESRFTVGEGLLQAIGAAVRQAQLQNAQF